MVVGPDGAPAAGVSVTVSVASGGGGATTVTDKAGVFLVPYVSTLTGGLCLSGYRTGGGEKSYFIAGGITPVPGGITATGTSALVVNDSAFVLIPAGTFQMGDTFGEGGGWELPVHPVTVSAFFLQACETTKAEWDPVYRWALINGYEFDNESSGVGAEHPVTDVNWYDALKWCNARSQKEGLVPCYYTDTARTIVYKTGQVDVPNFQVLWTANGYRLPTEAEWEKAARGGLNGKRFPWGDTISHSLANYISASSRLDDYDVSPTRGSHPKFGSHIKPKSSPVGSFAANGYGLYDMTGNASEWCWDKLDFAYYRSSPKDDPKGYGSGEGPVLRGGSYDQGAEYGRVASRHWSTLDLGYGGFRVIRAATTSVNVTDKELRSAEANKSDDQSAEHARPTPKDTRLEVNKDPEPIKPKTNFKITREKMWNGLELEGTWKGRVNELPLEFVWQNSSYGELSFVQNGTKTILATDVEFGKDILIFDCRTVISGDVGGVGAAQYNGRFVKIGVSGRIEGLWYRTDKSDRRKSDTFYFTTFE